VRHAFRQSNQLGIAMVHPQRRHQQASDKQIRPDRGAMRLMRRQPSEPTEAEVRAVSIVTARIDQRTTGGVADMDDDIHF